jgi:secreted Zn-dependent insulinase-like peptidase
MEHKPVKSSNILTVAYNHETQVMEVLFRGQDTPYSFKKVPKHVYQGLMEAESPGGFFHQHVKGQYEHEKLGT